MTRRLRYHFSFCIWFPALSSSFLILFVPLWDLTVDGIQSLTLLPHSLWFYPSFPIPQKRLKWTNKPHLLQNSHCDYKKTLPGWLWFGIKATPCFHKQVWMVGGISRCGGHRMWSFGQSQKTARRIWSCSYGELGLKCSSSPEGLWKN